MSTVILFITLIAIIAIFAVFFACYQSQQRARDLQAAAQEQAESARHAAVIYSRPSYPPQGADNGRPRPRRIYHKIPTPSNVVTNLPTFSYDTSMMGPGEKEEPPTCVICCCEYEQDDKVKLLPCLHQYHEGCIDAWLKRDHICPICQADVVLAAGLSLHDWSVHTCEAINYLSGSAAAAAAAAGNRADPQPAAAAAGEESGAGESVHQPSTPTVRPATPAAAAVAAVEPAVGIVAVEEPGDSEIQAVRLVVLPRPHPQQEGLQQPAAVLDLSQQQQQQTQHHQQQQQQDIVPMGRAGVWTSGSSHSNSGGNSGYPVDGQWGADGSCVIIQPHGCAAAAAATAGGSSSPGHSHTCAAGSSDCSLHQAATQPRGNTSSTAATISTAAVATASAAPTAVAAAGAQATVAADHVVVDIPHEAQPGPGLGPLSAAGSSSR